jgi:hypothetical protein
VWTNERCEERLVAARLSSQTVAQDESVMNRLLLQRVDVRVCAAAVEHLVGGCETAATTHQAI